MKRRVWLRVFFIYTLLGIQANLGFSHAVNATRQDDLLDLLPAWNYDKMKADGLEALYNYKPQNPNVRLLAWHTLELLDAEDRPYRINAALLWIEFSVSSGKKKWALLDLYEHSSGKWFPSEVFTNTGWFPLRVFNFPPRNQQVYQFLQYWEFQPKKGKLVAAAIRKQTWQKVIGAAPTKDYALR